MVDSLQKVCIHGSSSVFSRQTTGTKESKHFKGQVDDRTKLMHHSGNDIFEMVKDLEVVFGKGPGSQPVPSENGLAPIWKKKSIFWGATILGRLRCSPCN